MRGDPVALVTGSGGVIGRAIALALSDTSSSIALNDIDGDKVGEVAALFDPSRIGLFPGDVAEPSTAASIVESVIERFGSIDILINAAGIEGPVGPIESLEAKDVRRVFAVNVLSIFWLCSAAVPWLKDRGGRIINIASGAGLAGGALTSPYNASKHAVVGITRSLARELAPFKVAVNAVCPGYVDSRMIESIAAGEAAITGIRPNFAESVPMGRLAEPEEVAKAVAYLSTDAPTYMTGTCLVLDGGLRA